ncbi:DUF1659 domain-containing protein [Microbacteriaceae bacterium 4G12]
MAIQTMVSDKSLRLVFNGGTNASGKPIMKSKLFKNVKLEAQPEKIHEVATAIASLQTHTLESVQFVSTTDVAAE